MLRFFLISVLVALALSFSSHSSLADDGGLGRLRERFDEHILPIISRSCLACHDGVAKEAELDLQQFQALDQVRRAHGVWEIVLERVEAGEMPPDDAAQSLSEAERRTLVEWTVALRDLEAARTAGDPGPVLARRLSNAEYDNSIRELTGFELRPTQSFPVDPANSAGFDNSGESLSMSPALLNQYLEAARLVAEHLVFAPQGLDFAPHPVVTDTDRDKYCVKRIVEFYQGQPTDLADYFYAAWLFAHRQQATTTLAEVAQQQQISPKYLATIWEVLDNDQPVTGPLSKLRELWQTLPQTSPTQQPEVAQGVQLACVAMRDYVLAARRQFEPHFANLDIRGVHHGSQPFVLWKNKQYANHRRLADFGFLETQLKKVAGDEPASEQLFALPQQDMLEQFKLDCQRFCDVFPDAFYVSERGRDYLDTPKEKQEKGRLLSAGFHSMMGYFRDDRPLMELILDESGQQTLDDLWQELDSFAAAPQRQYQGFLWFERTDSGFMRDAEFDFARPEDKAALTSPFIERLGKIYLAKATRNGGEAEPLAAIQDFFTEIDRQIQWVEQARIAAEPGQVDALLGLAKRANRRPLAASEELALRQYYQLLRDEHGLTHEEAIQDALVSILMSPEFLYRVDLLSDSEQARPLDDYELASRLSYFLWSSPPDEQLLECAQRGALHNPEILIEQTRRMLGDWRVRGLALEFAGNWLDVRRFEEHNAVDRNHFQAFDEALRAAMFEEPLRFFTDVVQHNRSITDFLFSKRTFVNAALAQHYGMQHQEFAGDEWHEIENASEFGRGGLLPMAVFLTKNAPGLRTSPVKRGYWVVRRLLGERIPPPPPNVPELPSDESQLGELTLRETLAKHREHTSCAGCHDRIDSIGLVFENYGPIGELRELDLGGHAVDTRAEFPDGSSGDGLEDLKTYIQTQRTADFLSNFHRKLLAFALGRSLQLSDNELLKKMADEGAAGGNRIQPLVEAIVTSPQFLNKRGRDAAAEQTLSEGASLEQ